MIKLTMLATLIAGVTMGITTANSAALPPLNEDRDCELIVEVDRSLDSLTREGIDNSQRALYEKIRSQVSSNVRFKDSFYVLNNAFVVSINSNYINAVKSLPGVKSVTKNEMHFVTYSSPMADDDDEPEPDPVNDYGGFDNASASTMQKPGSKIVGTENSYYPGTTNDGEGTVIAILDNEFNFRAPTADDPKGFHHIAFSDLGDDVDVKFKGRPDLDLIKTTHIWNSRVEGSNTEYRWRTAISNAEIGKEGSLYFSNKIPFYFDYGGDHDYSGGSYDEDFDVSSEISYHGSHVASTAAGNDPNYYGIAPKAQLVCMKVFTNRKANKMDEAIGFQNSTGAYDVPILHALEDCKLLGVDCINMSLGSNLDDFDQDSITLKTLRDLADLGVLTSISAGNSGKSSYSFAGGYGNWTTDMVETGILGSYANSIDNTIVAAGQPVKKFYTNAFMIGSGDDASYIEYEDQVVNREGESTYDTEYKFHKVFGDASIKWVMVPGYGSSSDYDKLPEGTTVENNIAVVQRGSIDFATKYQNAKAKGAKGVIIVNNDPTATSFNFRCSFGDVQPELPIALVLFSDYEFFKTNGTGTFSVIRNKTGVNPKALTASSFSTDGARYDLELKPDITTPGENIRGAVPPQTKFDKNNRYDKDTGISTSYEFLSGTSMAAPNYAGAQAVILSKYAAEVYKDGRTPTVNEQIEYAKIHKTIDMRIMSTATPMYDYDDGDPTTQDNPEQENVALTSPRIQGAGMVNIGRAYNTSVYLEGKDISGNATGKAKISLKDISSNELKFNFIAHNESDAAKSYNAKVTVMRPAIKMANDIVSRNLNNRGDIESISSFPGHDYYTIVMEDHDGTIVPVGKKNTVLGDCNVGDVFHVTRKIEYWATAADCEADYGLDEPTHKETIDIGRYICKSVEKDNKGKVVSAEWDTLESTAYISTQDFEIGTYNLGTVEVAANENKEVSLSYNLTPADITKLDMSKFDYGCYLEGYIFLEDTAAENAIDLNMPWLGFYTGDENTDYGDAAVVEPFGFEKLDENNNPTSKIYPSELVNDLTTYLLGKSNVDFGSTWALTYVEPGKAYNQDPLLANDESLSHLCKSNSAYHLAGTNADGEYYPNPADNIYAGSATKTNTMLIQQYVMRSIKDNYFSIVNKDTGEVVHNDVLQDMLFGQQFGRWPLYKSHVDDSYLGAGYVAHRAFAVIPLYDTRTGEPFPSGDYEITFNYILAADDSLVSKSYSFHIDSENPTVDGVRTEDDKFIIDVNDKTLDRVTLGKYRDSFKVGDDGKQYIEMSKSKAILYLNESLNSNREGRLYLGLTDKAYGRAGALIKFDRIKNPNMDEIIAQARLDGLTNNEISTIQKGGFIPDFSKYYYAVHESFELSNDFEVANDGTVTYYKIVNKVSQPIELSSKATFVSYRSFDPVPPAPAKGCGGNVTTTSIILTAVAGSLVLAILFAKRKRKYLGGN